MDFPEELNIKIFSYLDHDSLMSVSQVCKSFRSTIFGSMELMNNSKLLLHDMAVQKQFLLNHGKVFRTVQIVKKSVRRSCGRSELMKMLINIENVRKMEVAGSFIFRKNENVKIPLANLRKLVLKDAANSFRMSQFLDGVKLKSLTLVIEKTGNYLDQSFLDWFYKQDQLKTVHIKEKATKIFSIAIPVTQIKFQLKKLIIQPGAFRIGTRAAEASFRLNFLTFLSSQVELEEVHFVPSGRNRYEIASMWREIYTFLMTSKTLKKIAIYDYCLRSITQENKTLESLVFDNPCLHLDNPWENLLKLKNLKHLEISEVYRLKELFLCSEQMPLLESLSLCRRISCGHDDGVFTLMKFPNLQSLSLKNIHINSRDWISISSSCPLIKKLSLDLFFLENESVSTMLDKWSDFETLELGCGIYTPGMFHLLNTLPSFKLLKVTRKMKQHLDAILPARNFKTSVAKTEIRIPQANEYCSITEFAKANRNILYLSMFLNNLSDFIIFDN
jgi:hypothetical protein